MSLLKQAVIEGDIDAVRGYIENGYDIREDRTLLHSAIDFSHGHVAELLIEHGADCSATDEQGRTPLFLACLLDDPSINHLAQMMIERGADVNAANENHLGRTPLHAVNYLPQGGNIAMARLLLQNGADVDSNDNWGWTPLYLACTRHHVGIAEVLIEHGADVNAANEKGTTPLHAVIYAIDYQPQGGNIIAMASLLLENGADVDSNDNGAWGSTPLHFACVLDHVGIAQVLIEHGADVNAKDEEGITPLHSINYNRRGGNIIAIARLLLENGADIESADNEGRTPLHFACALGNVDVVQLLLDSGANIEAADTDGLTPLFSAVVTGSEEAVELLLERNANVHAATADGADPLHSAVLCGRVNIAALLLQYGADCNAVTLDGLTPLHKACALGRLVMVQWLVDNGADVHLLSHNRTSPLHCACKFALDGSLEIVRLLLENGVDCTTENVHGVTPLHEAVDCIPWKTPSGERIAPEADVAARHDLVQLLIASGADCGAVDWYGRIPLHIAVGTFQHQENELLEEIQELETNGGRSTEVCKKKEKLEANRVAHLDMIQSFVAAAETSVDKHDAAGNTPLLLACTLKDHRVAEYLANRGAGVMATNAFGYSPLQLAAGKNSLDFSLALLLASTGTLFVPSSGEHVNDETQ